MGINVLQYDAKMRYMLLDRMLQDCKYYLGYGSKNIKYLWSKDEKEHIENMKALYNSFPDEEKPQWITMGIIEEYESAKA